MCDSAEFEGKRGDLGRVFGADDLGGFFILSVLCVFRFGWSKDYIP